MNRHANRGATARIYKSRHTPFRWNLVVLVPGNRYKGDLTVHEFSAPSFEAILKIWRIVSQ